MTSEDSTPSVDAMPLRIVPLILLRDGVVIRSEGFSDHRSLGPFDSMVRRVASWNVDEIVVLNTTSAWSSAKSWVSGGDRRTPSDTPFLEIIRTLATSLDVPLSVGGGIRSVGDALEFLANGADRIVVNTLFQSDPECVQSLIRQVGAQAVVVSLDVVESDATKHRSYCVKASQSGVSQLSLQAQLQSVDALRPGELLLQSVPKDGSGTGFDLDLALYVASHCTTPFMLASGAGNEQHFLEASRLGARALVAGNMWHYKELVGPRIKQKLRKGGISVRGG